MNTVSRSRFLFDVTIALSIVVAWAAGAGAGTITSLSEGTQTIGSLGSISVDGIPNGNINSGTSFNFATLINTGSGTGYFAGLFQPASQFFTSVNFNTITGGLTLTTTDFGTFTSTSITELVNDPLDGVRQFLFNGNFSQGNVGGPLTPNPAAATFTLNITQDPAQTGSVSADGSLGLVAVPEPSTLALLGLGGVALAVRVGLRRRR